MPVSQSDGETGRRGLNLDAGCWTPWSSGFRILDWSVAETEPETYPTSLTLSSVPQVVVGSFFVPAHDMTARNMMKGPREKESGSEEESEFGVSVRPIPVPIRNRLRFCVLAFLSPRSAGLLFNLALVAKPFCSLAAELINIEIILPSFWLLPLIVFLFFSPVQKAHRLAFFLLTYFHCLISSLCWIFFSASVMPD